MDRRGFLTALAAGWLVSQATERRPPPRGRIVGASAALGHRLRGGGFEGAPRGPTERRDVVIVGAGVSGLSAAWRLGGTGASLLVLELEPFAGGTSGYGEHGVIPHPFGAHYLPLPNVEARATLRLLAELGVVTGWDAAGRPRYNDRHLCHDPVERLFYEAAWHPGLVPWDALSAGEREEMRRFEALEERLTAERGADGRPVFHLPLELSSRDPAWLALDRLSLEQWLEGEGFLGPFLRWYVRHAMLDDYGAEPGGVSAWAGLHYFAARKSHPPGAAGGRYLVWPEGNGRLVRGLLERCDAELRHRALALDVSRASTDLLAVTYLDAPREELRRVEARAVVLAVPGQIAGRVAAPLLAGGALPRRASAPWMVANLHVRRPIGTATAWDSVVHGARGLGYVDAGHQRLAPDPRTVLTYYRAYGEADAPAARARLAAAKFEDLAEEVLDDLRPAHPDLRAWLERAEVMVWGHGMPRPTPGFLGEAPFHPPVEFAPGLYWAHVDQPGVALFEEAQQRGVDAAERAARRLALRAGESWL